jgi:murein DD-endopeptidase MepM/ murein hydrolase activator NlpD
VADIFDWRIDMSRDLQRGDRFSVLVERKRGPEGTVKIGRILAAVFANGGSTIQAVRFERAGDRARYYDQNGRSLEANFLSAPLSFRRISSVFGLRKHPILGIWRQHTGTDYAAEAGTPVRAIGDGVVIAAGVRGGYGNAIDVRHANGFVSRYGHLRAFARGVRAGTRVSMGQTIGFVGMTGLATAPHLHFEILVGGVQRNPRSALSRTGGQPLPDADRARFETFKTRYLGLLSGTPSLGN